MPGLGLGAVIVVRTRCGQLLPQLDIAPRLAVAAQRRFDFLRPGRPGLRIDERDERIVERQRHLCLHVILQRVGYCILLRQSRVASVE